MPVRLTFPGYGPSEAVDPAKRPAGSEHSSFPSAVIFPVRSIMSEVLIASFEYGVWSFPEIMDYSESAKLLAVVYFHHSEKLQRFQLPASDPEKLGVGLGYILGQIGDYCRLYVADFPPFQAVVAAFEDVFTYFGSPLLGRSLIAIVLRVKAFIVCGFRNSTVMTESVYFDRLAGQGSH